MSETLRTVIAAVLGGAVAAAASITAASLGYFNKDRELDIEMVRISLSILKGENKGTDTLPARRFALRALKRFSTVDIPDAEFEEWVARGTVPFDPTPSTGWYEWGKYEDNGYSDWYPAGGGLISPAPVDNAAPQPPATPAPAR